MAMSATRKKQFSMLRSSRFDVSHLFSRVLPTLCATYLLLLSILFYAIYPNHVMPQQYPRFLSFENSNSV